MGRAEAKGHLVGGGTFCTSVISGKKAELRRKSKARDTKNLIYIYRLGKAQGSRLGFSLERFR